jgi:type II secretory pathway predicted ATPase ExeA
MIEKLQSHYGFTRMPFGRDLAPGMLHRHAAHNEAVARITWCIAERAIGVITGEVGAGKTVSVRTVLAGLDATRHTVIYLPNPMIGVRGVHEAIITTFGREPRDNASPSVAATPAGCPAAWPRASSSARRTRNTDRYPARVPPVASM